MTKNKVAISIDDNLLNLVDSKVDGSIIRSRSQAMEFYLRKGLEGESVINGVILIKASHQKFSTYLHKGRCLIMHQIDLLQAAGVRKIFVLTQSTKHLPALLNAIASVRADVEVVERDVPNNTCAIAALEDRLASTSFVVLSGDTYYDFDLANMVRKHAASGLLSTMGLMTSVAPTHYGNAVLSGDLIVDFAEKPAKATSLVVNAGIYVFRPEIFALLETSPKRLEVSLFPKLARIKQLLGHFAYGEYMHFSD